MNASPIDKSPPPQMPTFSQYELTDGNLSPKAVVAIALANELTPVTTSRAVSLSKN